METYHAPVPAPGTPSAFDRFEPPLTPRVTWADGTHPCSMPGCFAPAALVIDGPIYVRHVCDDCALAKYPSAVLAVVA